MYYIILLHIYIYSDKYFDMSSDFSPDIYSDMYGSLTYMLTYMLAYILTDSDIWSDISDIDPSKFHVTQTPTCILTYIPAFCSASYMICIYIYGIYNVKLHLDIQI